MTCRKLQSYPVTSVLPSIHFPLCTALAVPYKISDVVLSFSFISTYFLIPFVISSLTYWLFRNVWFSFHIFVNFPHFPAVTFSKLATVWSQNILCMILLRPFTVTQYHFMTSNVAYPRRPIPGALDKNVDSALVGGVLYTCLEVLLVYSGGGWFMVVEFTFSYFLSHHRSSDFFQFIVLASSLSFLAS